MSEPEVTVTLSLRNDLIVTTANGCIYLTPRQAIAVRRQLDEILGPAAVWVE